MQIASQYFWFRSLTPALPIVSQNRLVIGSSNSMDGGFASRMGYLPRAMAARIQHAHWWMPLPLTARHTILYGSIFAFRFRQAPNEVIRMHSATFTPNLAPESMMAGSRVLAVINPASGDTDPATIDPVLDLLNRHLGERGIEVQVIPFAPEILAASLRDALGEDVRAIYVAGGDGTLLSVVTALDGYRVPLGIPRAAP
jgi:hypothetical protein